MTKEELVKLKKKLVMLGVLGVMVGTSGCKSVNNNDIPVRQSIPLEYNSFHKYVEDIVQDFEVNKLCKTENVYLLYDKETYEVKEYIFNNIFEQYSKKYGMELYDIDSEELICYSDGIGNCAYNEDYYKYLINNNYVVSLANLSNYIEGIETKEYYNLEEIRELEPQILESLKIIINSKTKTK